MTKQDMEKDILILVLQLIGEDPDTFSPEVLEVMKRWQEKAHAVLQYDSVACLIAEGSEFMTKTELYDAIKKDMVK